MSTNIPDPVLISIVGAVATVLTAIFARRASPYSAIAARVVDLESRVESLEKELAAERAALVIERQNGLSAAAAHRAVESRLMAYIDTLRSLLQKHAPDAKIPPLTPPF